MADLSSAPRARATVAAGVLILALALPYVVAAVEFARIVWGGASLDAATRRELSTFGLSALETSNLVTIGFWAFLVVAVYTAVLGVGVLARREWARHGSLLTFIFFAMLMLPMGVAGVTYDPPSPNWWLGVLMGLGDLGVVGLLLTRGVSDDFGDADWVRRTKPLPPDPIYR